MTGLKLKPGEKYFRNIPAIGGAAVKQATEDILNTDVVSGTAANFSYQVEESSSYEHLLYEIGAIVLRLGSDRGVSRNVFHL